ncbi:MAG: fucose-binding lectin II [Pseudomonadota bacterium]
MKTLKTLTATFAVGAIVSIAATTAAFSAQSSCNGNVCTIPVINGAKCALSAYTNAADTWNMSAAQGGSTFNEQSGSGENDTPMKWTSGNAVFTAGGDTITVTFSANGNTNVKMRTNSGFADGTSSAIMNGEDGADTDYNDVIANVTCIK